jgi:hypothetical protein
MPREYHEKTSTASKEERKMKRWKEKICRKK